METLAGRGNRWLKTFRAALRYSAPSKDGWIGVEGARLVGEALASGAEFSALLISHSGERHLEYLAECIVVRSASLRVFRTSDPLFAGVSGTETPQGVAALVRPRACTFDDLLRGAVPLVLLLAGVQDPGNVGTALRSAEAFGATGAITTRGTACPWSPKALRASAGSALRLPILSGMAAPVALAQLRIAGLRIFAAHAKASGGDSSAAGALPPWRADLRGSVALLIGNEGSGLPPELEHSADALLRIPIASVVDSLNAGVAASMLLYEVARQRGRLD